MIANLASDPAPSSAPSSLTAAGDQLFFDAWDGIGTVTSNGGQPRALWRSDGTAEGTIKLLSPPGSEYVTSGGTLFFRNPGLWTSDGSPQGTRPASEFATRFPTTPIILATIGDTMYVLVG